MAIAIKGRADFPSQAAAPPALPKGEPSCAMTNLEASRIRRGAGTSLAVPPSRVIARSKASLALPLGELAPKVTERALQARSNGNSKQRESQVSLSGGCAASSPKGRAKYRSQRTAAVVHTAVAVNYLMNTPCPPEAFPCSGQYCEIAAPCSARLAMTSQETCRVWGGAQEEGRASAFPG